MRVGWISSGLLGTNAFLFAPQGMIDAGVPVAGVSLAANFAVSGYLASSASKDAESSMASNLGDNSDKSSTPLADAALSFLDVVVEGFGE